MKNFSKILSIILLIWYAALRWLVLAMSNNTSKIWLINSIGNVVALLSVVYLFLFIFKKNIGYNFLYLLLTIALLMFNTYFLLDMSKIFIDDPNIINLGYELLDIIIIGFYIMVISLYFRKNSEQTANETHG
jgi:hypothetical protein